jgi:CheY-specific phosphatase CheX
MSIKFFGQYLLEKNLISAEQLIEALKVQEDKNLRFGDYARAKGFMSDDDVMKLQAEQRRTDKKIGEIAVDMGLLTERQVEEILTMQENDHIYLGEALRHSGYIDHETLYQELELFRDDQREFIAGVVSVPGIMQEVDVIKSAVDLTKKMFKRLAFVEAKPGFGEPAHEEPTESYTLVSVKIHGAAVLEYALSVPREAAVAVAGGLIEEDASDEPDDILIDSVKEFCNITCGSVMARMAKRGKRLHIDAPEEHEAESGKYELIKGRTAARYPIVSSAGNLQLFLIEG